MEQDKQIRNKTSKYGMRQADMEQDKQIWNMTSRYKIYKPKQNKTSRYRIFKPKQNLWAKTELKSQNRTYKPC